MKHQGIEISEKFYLSLVKIYIEVFYIFHEYKRDQF